MENINWAQIIDSDIINKTLQGPIGSIVGALILFVVGVFFAMIAKYLVQKLTNKLNLNKNLQKNTDSEIDVEGIIGKIIFWLVIIMTASVSLNVLEITMMSEALSNMVEQILLFIPKLVAIGTIALIGWILAAVARNVIKAIMQKFDIDKKVSEMTDDESADSAAKSDSKNDIQPISVLLSDTVYWFVLLLTFTTILGKLNLNGLFNPLNNMLNEMVGYLPNIFMAVVVFVVGMIAGKIVKAIVVNIVSATNLKLLGNKMGISKSTVSSLPNAIGSLVYLLIIIPTTLIALDALQITTITKPVENMLNKVMLILPNVFSAIGILVVTYFICKLLVNIVEDMLKNTFVDSLPSKIGVQGSLGDVKLSKVIGNIIMLYAMLIATTMASGILGFGQVNELIKNFIVFGSNILFGTLIMFVGFWLANLVADMVKNAKAGSEFLANFVRVIIIGLVLAMGLQAMNIADAIVNMAFGMTLGSAAIAFAVAFGIGGYKTADILLRNSKLVRDIQAKQEASKADDK